MNARYAKWMSIGLAGLMGLAAAPVLADDDYDDWDDDDGISVRYYSYPRSYERETYRYSYRPSYRTYGYIEGDYTTPEHAWWRDYEAMNAERRADTWRGYRQGQFYGYAEPRTVTLRGRIVDLREFRSSEWTRPHLVAFVDTGDDRGLDRVVLGPVDRVGSMDVRVGDRITVSGTARSIDGVRSVVAGRFETPGARWSRGYTESSGDWTRPAAHWYQGEIRDDDHEKIGGVKRTLLRVKLNTGEDIQVDLGPTDALPDLDFDRGDDIAFFGRRGTLEGKTTVFADEFRWQGRAFVLHRGFDADVHAYR